MKTTKGGKVMNPTDAYRKELRKKELKRNKKERKKVREVGILKKDPDSIKEQIEKLEAMKSDGALDKARKHKKRQLEDTYNLVVKKRKEYESKMREKGEEPVMFSHLGPPRRRTTAEEEEDRAKHPKPEDSVYYHPTLNPTGAPPAGKPQMYKSSIGLRIPLSAASSSGAASSSLAELDDVDLSVPPPPPPPPPMPHAGEVDIGDGSIIPESLPLPPPPPQPPKPAVADLGTALPPPPMPPPPPGPPPKEQTANHQLLPLPPAVHKSQQPPPPGTGGLEREKNQSAKSDSTVSQEPVQRSGMLPPPPPPPGLPPKPAGNQSEGAPSKSNTTNNLPETKDLSNILPPPPPPRQQAPIPGPPLHPALQQDVLPPGISRIPPPPPPDMRPQLSAPGMSGQQVPHGMMVPLMPRPPYGPPPGPPLMMRPPLPPGPPPMALDDIGARPFVPQKPSYVKSAASTVVKRPLAQHTPQLTSMVPASVRVRRESAVPKLKPKPSISSATAATLPKAAPAVAKKESGTSSSAPKPQSMDDSYMAFLEDMKALGALDS